MRNRGQAPPLRASGWDTKLLADGRRLPGRGTSMVQEYGLFIGGKWKKTEGKRVETINPATGEVLATFPSPTKEEVGDAGRAAKGAFERWRKTPPPPRRENILQAARNFRRGK